MELNKINQVVENPIFQSNNSDFTAKLKKKVVMTSDKVREQTLKNIQKLNSLK